MKKRRAGLIILFFTFFVLDIYVLSDTAMKVRYFSGNKGVLLAIITAATAPLVISSEFVFLNNMNCIFRHFTRKKAGIPILVLRLASSAFCLFYLFMCFLTYLRPYPKLPHFTWSITDESMLFHIIVPVSAWILAAASIIIEIIAERKHSDKGKRI